MRLRISPTRGGRWRRGRLGRKEVDDGGDLKYMLWLERLVS